MRGLTLSWERVDRAKPGTGVGRDQAYSKAIPQSARGLTAPFTQGSLPLFRRCGGTFPQGKVDRAQPGPDEGCRAKITKQATLDGKRFRSTWPVFDFSWVSPHPSGP